MQLLDDNYRRPVAHVNRNPIGMPKRYRIISEEFR
jgi:hypothetical protein